LRPLASLSRVDACNPLLQAHPTWARDEHEGRGIPTSLTPVSGRLAPPPFTLALALDLSGMGHAATLTRRPKGPPGLGTPTIGNNIQTVVSFAYSSSSCAEFCVATILSHVNSFAVMWFVCCLVNVAGTQMHVNLPIRTTK
jgi:hypothetical protein